MIFGNAAWGFRETPLETQLEITRNMGLDLLELQIAGHTNDFLQLNASDGDILQVKKLFEQYSIKLICASTGNDFTFADEDECITSMQNVKKVIDIAQKLDIRYLRIFAGFSPVAEVIGTRWNFMIKMLNEVLGYADERNVLPAIETHGGVEAYFDDFRYFNSVTTVKEKLIKLFKELKHPTGIVFDPGNLGAVGLNEDEIIDWYHNFKAEISYMHLKDFRKVDDDAFAPCAPSEGQLDWTKLMREFNGFPGPGMIEYELTEDIKDGLSRSLEILQPRPTAMDG